MAVVLVGVGSGGSIFVAFAAGLVVAAAAKYLSKK